MIAFRFKVNRSFLEWPSHPITVPRSQVDYQSLERELGHTDSLEIITPEGERLRGTLHYGVAGYGPYYQIRIPDRASLSEFRLGQTLRIKMQSSGEQISVSLLSP